MFKRNTKEDLDGRGPRWHPIKYKYLWSQMTRHCFWNSYHLILLIFRQKCIPSSPATEEKQGFTYCFEVSHKIITCFPFIHTDSRQEIGENEVLWLEKFFIWSSETIRFNFSFQAQIHLLLFLHLCYSPDVIWFWIFCHLLLARRGLRSDGTSIGNSCYFLSLELICIY